jgi:hypothetical protein
LVAGFDSVSLLTLLFGRLPSVSRLAASCPCGSRYLNSCKKVLAVSIANAGIAFYIKNFPLIELLCCTMCITSAKSGAQLTTFIFFDSFSPESNR